MRRKGFISPSIETIDNFILAFSGFSKEKHSRRSIRKYEDNLIENLSRLLDFFVTETWVTSPWVNAWKLEKKWRLLTKYPIDDHVIQWAALNRIEDLLCNTFIRRSCSCVKGRGTQDFVDLLRLDMNDVKGSYYFVQLDVHHFFLNISKDMMSGMLRLKIKDAKLLRFLDEIIYSYYMGLPLGIKISQIFANFFLCYFDHLAVGFFDILKDQDKAAYWCDRYVTDSFLTCRTAAQAKELNKGVEYMRSKFFRFASEGLLHYSRFADNIVIQHEDKTFLHIVTEIAVMHLTRDYRLPINRNWNVRPVFSGGIDVCGYVSFHDHRRARKDNKKNLCREVAKLRKKGLNPEQIRLKCASRIGFTIHADSKNLLRKLDINMEKRLGAVIKSRKHNIPFKGMRFDQKKPFSEIVCKIGDFEDNFKILLIDFKIEDSRVETEEKIVEVVDDNGNKTLQKIVVPQKCLALRYKKIIRTDTQKNIDGEDSETYVFEKERSKDGFYGDKDAEYYSYTGSRVMIEQAETDFSKEDLPCPTVIAEFANKLNKKFFKFT